MIGKAAREHTLLNRYLAMTPVENLDALAALPLFMSLARSLSGPMYCLPVSNRAGDDKADVMQSARGLFRGWARLTIRPPAPKLVGRRRAVRNRKIRFGAAPLCAWCPRPSPGSCRVTLGTSCESSNFKLNETDRGLPASAYQPQITRHGSTKSWCNVRPRILVQGHSVVGRRGCSRLKRNEPRSCDAARKLEYPVWSGSFPSSPNLAIRLSPRRPTVNVDAFPNADARKIAEIQEKYDIGAVDWARDRCIWKLPAQTLKQCQTRNRSQ